MGNTKESIISTYWLLALSQAGLRATLPRKAIVDVMVGSQLALEPVEVYDIGRHRCPGLGLVTVYRTLEKLEQLNLVQRVHMQNGCHRYLRASQEHEHLLLCRKCGRAEVFHGDDLSTLFDEIAQSTGYQIENHWLQLNGICPVCQEVAKA